MCKGYCRLKVTWGLTPGGDRKDTGKESTTNREPDHQGKKNNARRLNALSNGISPQVFAAVLLRSSLTEMAYPSDHKHIRRISGLWLRKAVIIL